jgi:polysaccharide export outer membrane protein
MPLIDQVKAGGLTPAELERAIRDQYLNRKFYKYVTVNVNLPSRSYFISGEVRAPGRFPLLGGGTTLRQAIAAAGGYTDFADRKKIEVKRGNNIMRFSAEAVDKGEQEDLTIETGDVINVNRSWY